MSDNARLAAHLRLFSEMGINGVSRDASWRDRANLTAASGPEGPALDAELSAGGAPDAGTPDASAAAATPDAAAFAALPMTPAADGLAALRTHIGDCMRCQLGRMGRKQVVFGVGDPAARLMFVGEGPGADEDQQGEPFVGQAGQLLTKIIAAIDFTRSDVFIANVVKCRPPGNRNPEPIEVESCSPFLLRQIEIIRPRVIVALGAFAAQTLLQTKVPISKLRGHVHEFRPGTKVIPTFHPSFLLRNRNNRDLYRDVWEDVKKARALLTAP
jgi:DNA polymerase